MNPVVTMIILILIIALYVYLAIKDDQKRRELEQAHIDRRLIAELRDHYFHMIDVGTEQEIAEDRTALKSAIYAYNRRYSYFNENISLEKILNPINRFDPPGSW